jgi:bifunctional non-homologous end joining protein LigD
MAKKDASEIVTVAGREVAVSNPAKVLFPQAGYTKLDLVRYYLAVADGALRAAGDRPNVLVRYPNGVGSEFFYQKRAPDSRPDWVEVVSLRFPSGRTAEEVVPRDAATLAWMANLACLELHPHPVRADDLDHPDELRVDLDPVPGVEWPQIRAVAHVVQGALTDLGLVGWPKTSGSRGMHINVRIERRWSFDKVRRAALALAREVERRAPTLATSKWWKEERHGVFVDYNQNAKDRTVAAAYSVRPTPDARVSAPLAWDEIDTCDPRDFTMVTMIPRFQQLGHRHADMDARAYSIDALLELSARHEREGAGDAPWPPHYRKQEGEPPRVQPSKRRMSDAPASEAATAAPAKRRRAANASADGDAAATAAPTPKRRVSKHPLIEIGRAQKKEDVLAGLERWKAKHPEAAALLEPPDVLVDAMRGRHQVWWRIRVNLQHVPPEQRPAQEPLDPDEDPVALAWGVTAEEAREWMRTHRRPSRARKES